ncbi:MAG: MBL fold metallo-hydrolase [Dehalococcoidia bacterium]|nr:MBL fold metallo-hydrolase [Dehalococcoidia bacterium]
MRFTVTVVYDNETLDRSLGVDWGFAAVIVDASGKMLLFDTGAGGPLLEANMMALGFNADAVSAIVLSHFHWDHAGGLATMLHRVPHVPLYVPEVAQGGLPDGAIVVGASPLELSESIYSTGTLGGMEQGIVLLGDRGAFVITGCAHPGVPAFLAAADTLGRPYGLMGGFHGFSDLEKLCALDELYPCHCTQRKEQILRRFPGSAKWCGAGLRVEV